MTVLASSFPLQELGAGCFGAVIGWFTYYVNRYRTGEVKLKDIGTLVGIIGGGAILTLFPEQSVLFASYGIGLAVGFFGYFVTLLLLVKHSGQFTVAWFLDGRTPVLDEGEQGAKDGQRPPMTPRVKPPINA
jgi:hypothetical protein